MGTRSTTHFQTTYEGVTRTEAIIFRHWDGYPEVAGRDIFRFFQQVQTDTEDTRFGDASMLAARYVSFLGDIFATQYDWNNGGAETKGPPLSFLSVRVLMDDPGDIEYRYLVNCTPATWPPLEGQVENDGWPPVTVETVGHGKNPDGTMNWDDLIYTPGPQAELDQIRAEVRAAALA